MRNFDFVRGNEVAQSMATLDLAVLGNARNGVFARGNIRRFRKASLSKIEHTDKTRELFRRISEWPKSTEGEINARNDLHDARNPNEGYKLIDDYDICGNRGVVGGLVKVDGSGNQLGDLPPKLKKGNATMGKGAVWKSLNKKCPGGNSDSKRNL